MDEFDSFDDYMNDIVKAGTKANLDDIGTLLTIAVLQSGPHFDSAHLEAAITTLEMAIKKLANLPIGKDAAEILGAAIYQMNVIVESRLQFGEP